MTQRRGFKEGLKEYRKSPDTGRWVKRVNEGCPGDRKGGKQRHEWTDEFWGSTRVFKSGGNELRLEAASIHPSMLRSRSAYLAFGNPGLEKGS